MLLSFSYEGSTFLDAEPGFLAASKIPADVILTATKMALKGRIDVAAESLRSTVLTAGSGQAMEYQEAQNQAFAALASPNDATADKYPMLAATIGVDIDPQSKAKATDVLGVARGIIAAYSAWNTIGAAIRGARLKGKAAVEAASDVDGACAAFDAIEWPTAA